MLKKNKFDLYASWRERAEREKNKERCEGCSGILIIKKGQLRVYTLSEQGKDITFYRLNDGDISILSASCVIKDITFDYCELHTCDFNHELGEQNSQRI